MEYKKITLEGEEGDDDLLEWGGGQGCDGFTEEAN